MAQVNGHCDAKFQGVREAFSRYILSGEEHGGSLAVNIDGRDVINLWGGYADAARTKPWNEDTIVNIWANTKIVCALAMLTLIDRGLVSLDDCVAKFWPEFATNGKERITIRHVLSHTSGVAGWDHPMTLQAVCDVDSSTAELAKQAPWWEPGTASGYHCWTYGHLIGEVVRRVTGLRLTEFVAKELCEPVGADLQIGVKEEDWARVAELVPVPNLEDFPAWVPGSIPTRVFNPHASANFAHDPIWRRAELGSVNGHGNALACTRLLSAWTLAGQGSDLVSKETAHLIFEEQVRGVDLFNGMFLRMGCGAMSLRGDGDTAIDHWLPAGRVGQWGGWGGSKHVMDLDRKLTFSYVMNKMRAKGPVTPVVQEFLKETYKVLGIEI
ncbi:beta-lactamase [Truncatella angustata]|uniref:Beta-lactamase n=1 Tax=Truncatella angustata TaxID=152316 RepID=A0A9P8RG39_9PEZI|nr:beta-lactamase [Truncatella angustata]KAH6645363.1 beta-lactamase [Truncatella angustata]KAH8200313.1 hypothetical protein TruAng_005529 [Truncatella angustata]